MSNDVFYGYYNLGKSNGAIYTYIPNISFGIGMTGWYLDCIYTQHSGYTDLESFTNFIHGRYAYCELKTEILHNEGAEILPGRSNRNLLDNPWFTINQRGQDSYTGAIYGLDRWLSNTIGLTVTKQTNCGIRIKSILAGVLSQIIDSTIYLSLAGKTVTLSIKLASNSTIHSGDGIRFNINGTPNTIYFANSDIGNIVMKTVTLPSTLTSLIIQLVFSASADYIVECVKLELGSVSTLVNDSAPDYGEELLKCQRYYYRLQGDYLNIGCGETRSTTTCYIGIPLPVIMRAIPILSTNIQNTNYCRIYCNGSINYPVSANIVTRNNNNIIGVNFQTSSEVLTTNHVAAVCLNDNNAYIEFSADLYLY